MTRLQITAGLAALLLGGGLAGACGNRESEHTGNPGSNTPEGTPQTIETGPASIVPTGSTEPTVTQGG